MNRRYLTFLFLFLFTTFIEAAEIPFSKGVNLTGWLQTSSVRQIQFTKYTKQDFINIKELGCDVVRLPINLHAMTNGAPDYTLDDLFYFFIDPIADWAEELEICLILDNHSFNPDISTDPAIEDILIPVWKQMASHFKNRSSYILYEVLNEPHDISDDTWNTIQQNVINAIRSIDTKHTIVIGGAGWNSYHNLTAMPVYSDSNLIYTFHFYEPFLFTHQGADWTSPSLGPFSAVPFPFDAGLMPDLPQVLAGTWVASAFNDYNVTGTVASVQQQLDIAVAFKNERDVPLYCGEFGVYRINSDNDQRVNWYGVVSDYLTSHGIGWTIWDYQGGFGLFEKGTNEFFDYDLNIAMVEALELNSPPQYEFTNNPDSAGFTIYDDYIAPGIQEASQSSGITDFYDQNNIYAGDFCIHWSGASQYNNIGFAFKPVKDLSYLAANDFALDMMVRGDSDSAGFDVRFVDSKTSDANDHPWRMNKHIDNSYGPWDNTWRHIRIPFSDFNEQGSWDSTWYPAQGDFDWSQIAYFQIVAENQALNNIHFWFDNIKIVNQNSPLSINDLEKVNDTFVLRQNYPNPFNALTKFEYIVKGLGNKPQQINLTIYNILGQKVTTLVDRKQSAGTYQVNFNAGDLSSGIYYYKLIVKDHYAQTKKMILLK